MSDIKSVSIIGCGWFGLPLAKKLLMAGLSVKGCKRTPEGVDEIRAMGVEAYRLDLQEDAPVPESLLQADCLIINLPPGIRRGDTDYLERLAKLKDALTTIPKRLLFISTTGVYPDLPAVLDEGDASAHSPGAAILLGAEALFAGLNTTVVRFAGLVGPGRHPGRFFAGRTDVSGGALPVNIVHLDDCLSAVQALIAAPSIGRCYNLCAPGHPSKQTFYTEAARSGGFALPQFAADNGNGKVIDGSLICRELGVHYRYADPLAMLVEAGAF
ncbi:SDR family NAD(P)-dependent oxidoreductase [Shewanella sp.]|uniref:SDR family NAD(P)-dependent oxidoreductase n=1 Tax=Shewanella sp. TaxID=50422 RepID=UPI003562AFA4